ncbi:MAG TPA: SCO family protein [Chitinophagales bacterium]|nr:SCO family protein [Chitinophagales bacterium]HMW12885.1 SCO family protein [Chitinophagales bacterium]HMX59081.1 SCO family protein [Chitinophagales bacterium]HMY22907.1 SCO family protein [Chitinophagales bacterium]HMZ33934.1 SCO family protein [Chitinophagales bacterium]
MNNSKKTGFIAAVVVVALFPLLFFLFFNKLNNHRPTLETDRCLPIYGPKQAFPSTDYRGRDIIDTAYFKVPDFSFLDQNGDTVTQKLMNGKVTVVDFFFTTCKNICIDMTSNLHKVQETFITDRDVLILSHTVDPESDSVQQLFHYAVEKDVNSKMWRLLTGDKKAIYKQARVGYFITADQGDGGPSDFIHDQKFVVIDKEKRIRGYYDGTDKAAVDQMIKDIQMLLVSYIVPMKKDDPKYKKTKNRK